MRGALRFQTDWRQLARNRASHVHCRESGVRFSLNGALASRIQARARRRFDGLAQGTASEGLICAPFAWLAPAAGSLSRSMTVT